jgi:hypothetical protein
MRKILLSILTLLLIFTLSCLVYSNNTDKAEDKVNHYKALEKNYGINATIHFRIYGKQKILEVPNIEIHTVGNDKILTYRTEFHNSTTDNGCLKVFNIVKDKKLTPIFVLEELVLSPWEDRYYQRVIKEFSNNKIEFDLYEKITKGENRENGILSVILEKDKNGFKVKSVTEFQKGFSQWASLGSSEVYDSLQEEILKGEY